MRETATSFFIAKWRWTESIICASRFGNDYVDLSTPHRTIIAPFPVLPAHPAWEQCLCRRRSRRLLAVDCGDRPYLGFDAGPVATVRADERRRLESHRWSVPGFVWQKWHRLGKRIGRKKGARHKKKRTRRTSPRRHFPHWKDLH